MHLNAEISGDGEKIVFVSDVNYDGSGIPLPKGDMEIFVHHVPTMSTHRVTYSHDSSSDDLFPHISNDGSTIGALAPKRLVCADLLDID